jgi:hypothetical protein
MTAQRTAALWLTVAAALACVPGPANAGETDWPAITNLCKPWTYWWWMGSAVTPDELQRHARTYAKAGLGGMHIIPIYGAEGAEPRYVRYLSPQWMDMLDTAVETAAAEGLGIDMTPGTGWPYGGPWVGPEQAARQAWLKKFQMTPAQTAPPVLCLEQPEAPLQALTALGPRGETLDLTARVAAGGQLDWKPEEGNWTLYALFQGWTKQQVKRAAPGGEGNVLDHFSRAHLEAYLARFDEMFTQERARPRAFYMDSYEAYGANWTDGFFARFQARCGYDLRLNLRELDGQGDAETAGRVRSDYNETIGELLLEDCARPWAAWAKAKGCITRYEAHGSPGNLLDLYAAADVPETEGFGPEGAEILMTKFASSAAHIGGKKLVASESCTWLAEHFTETLASVKTAMDQLFLGGVNHVFYHGTAFSPADAPWPGWLFYASTHFGPTNTFYHDFPELNAYIARCQSFLQAGEPDTDVLLYWPLYDLWVQELPAEKTKNGPVPWCLSVHGTKDWMHTRLARFHGAAQAMWDSGVQFDYVSDKLLKTATPRVVVLPGCKRMPPETMARLAELAAQGTTIIALDGLPGDVPGLNDLEPRRARLRAASAALRAVPGRLMEQSNLTGALSDAGVRGETITASNVAFVRQRIDGGVQYFLVNRGTAALDGYHPLAFPAKGAVLFDPLSGRKGVAALRSAGAGVELYLQLAPGATCIVRAYDHPVAGEPWATLAPKGAPQEIKGKWDISFVEGGPALPADFTSDTLKLWTDQDVPETTAFSGIGKYTVIFEFQPDAGADEWLLDLGILHETARVRLNGQDAGTVWCGQPLRVGSLLKTGANTLEVEAANLMANRIADMDRRGEKWRNYFFVNIDYKPFDAANWPVRPSGLAGPVRLCPMAKVP